MSIAVLSLFCQLPQWQIIIVAVVGWQRGTRGGEEIGVGWGGGLGGGVIKGSQRLALSRQCPRESVMAESGRHRV